MNEQRRMIDTDARELATDLFRLNEHRRQAILDNVLKKSWPGFRQHWEQQRGEKVTMLKFTSNPAHLYRFLEFAFRQDRGLAGKVRVMMARQEGV